MTAKRLTVLFAFIGLTLAAALGRADDDEPRHKWVRKWERRGPPVTKRIAFAIDVSGSMTNGGQLDLARQELMTIASLFPDDGHIKVYAFGDKVYPWQKDWTQLPDAEALEELWKWLSGFGDTSAYTYLAEGVEACLSNPDPKLTVILISDGSPTGSTNEEALARIKAAGEKRKEGMPPIHVIGISWPWTFEERAFLRAVADSADGSMVTWRRDDDPKLPDVAPEEGGDLVPRPPPSPPWK